MGCLLVIFAIFFAGFGLSASTSAAEIEGSSLPERPRPLVMLTEYNPWRMVIGSDTPTFVLYDTQLLIYVRETADGYEQVSVTLDDEEFDALLASFDSSDFYTLDDNYAVSSWTDQANNVICVQDEDSAQKCVSVYGDLHHPMDGDELENAPDAFLSLYDELISYEHPDVERWHPEMFEVILWEYDNGSPVDVPDYFPHLDSETVIQRDSVYSVYLRFDHYSDFLGTVRNSNAVRVDGQTWAYGIRFLYPHEETPELQDVP